MTQLLPVVAFLIFLMAKYAFGESVQVRVRVGDPVQFPVPESCEPAKLFLADPTGLTPVSAREGGVCKPAEGYEDRVDQRSCFAFTRALGTDAGEYELRCKDRGWLIILEIEDKVTPTEGDSGSAGYFNTTSTGTTPSPPLTTTQSVPGERRWTFDGWTALLTFAIVAPLFCLLGWFLKTRCSPGDPPGPGGGQYIKANGEIRGNVPGEIGLTIV